MQPPVLGQSMASVLGIFSTPVQSAGHGTQTTTRRPEWLGMSTCRVKPEEGFEDRKHLRDGRVRTAPAVRPLPYTSKQASLYREFHAEQPTNYLKTANLSPKYLLLPWTSR